MRPMKKHHVREPTWYSTACGRVLENEYTTSVRSRVTCKHCKRVLRSRAA